MAVTLNASTSSGLVQTADTSGVITLQNNGTAALTVDSGNLQFNSGYGSVATAYGCRAWVNFNGTSTVAIRASGNVTSITDNGTGDYTVNFTTAMPDADYAAMGCYQYAVDNTASGASIWLQLARYAQTTSAVRVACSSYNGTNYDGTTVTVTVFR